METLEYNGKEYNVKYRHFREHDDDGIILPNGGRTEAWIQEGIGKDSVVQVQAMSECSKKDSFYKALGRRIALGRLTKKVN